MEVIKRVPIFLAKIAKEIYLINDKKYQIFYDGTKATYREIENCEYLKLDKDAIINNKRVFVFIENENKIIIVVDLDINKEDINKDTILIADDSDLVIKFFKNIFENDFNIITASNGGEVIDLIESGTKIDALVLDLMMPVVSGFKVLEYLDQKNLFTTIPTLIISGDDSKDAIDRAMKYGVVDMIQKPFSVVNAKNIINKLFNQK